MQLAELGSVVERVPVSIPDAQLATWSNGGAVTVAKNTHESIRLALATSKRLQGRVYDTFLQGSYRNSTNVRGDSDVDLVVRLSSSYEPDISALTAYEQLVFRKETTTATYDWDDFREDVLTTLRAYFGSAVTEGKKAIKIARTSNRLAADVVVALEHRHFRKYPGLVGQVYDRGIWFKDLGTSRAIVNYPDQHYENGVAKNGKDRTGEMFKPVVRIFKNARSCLVEDRKIGEDVASSYHIQCLLYNVPDQQYTGTLGDMYRNIVNWLQKASLAGFVCQNGLVPLFGPTPEQWDVYKAGMLITALIKLWNEW
jgi:hypothetical protein